MQQAMYNASEKSVLFTDKILKFFSFLLSGEGNDSPSGPECYPQWLKEQQLHRRTMRQRPKRRENVCDHTGRPLVPVQREEGVGEVGGAQGEALGWES